MRRPACFDDRESRRRIAQVCAENQIDEQLLIDLAEIVEKFAGSGRRDGITADINQAIDDFLKRTEAGH